MYIYTYMYQCIQLYIYIYKDVCQQDLSESGSLRKDKSFFQSIVPLVKQTRKSEFVCLTIAFIYIYIYIFFLFIYVYMYIHLHLFIYIYIHSQIYTKIILIYVCIYICTNLVFMNIYVYN